LEEVAARFKKYTKAIFITETDPETENQQKSSERMIFVTVYAYCVGYQLNFVLNT